MTTCGPQIALGGCIRTSSRAPTGGIVTRTLVTSGWSRPEHGEKRSLAQASAAGLRTIRAAVPAPGGSGRTTVVTGLPERSTICAPTTPATKQDAAERL